MAELRPCYFCGYKETCIGSIPDSFGNCMGFFVPKELADEYRLFVAKEFTQFYVSGLKFLDSLGASDEDRARYIREALPGYFVKYLKHFEALSINGEVSSDGQ